MKPELQEAYEEGLNDAWKALRRLYSRAEDGGFNYSEMSKIFYDIYYSGIRDIVLEVSAQEVISRIKKYDEEKAKKIEVGSIWKSKLYNSTVVVCQLRNNIIVDYYTSNNPRLIISAVDDFLESYTPTGNNIKDFMKEGKEE